MKLIVHQNSIFAPLNSKLHFLRNRRAERGFRHCIATAEKLVVILFPAGVNVNALLRVGLQLLLSVEFNPASTFGIDIS
jgi:hypothetical protein